MLKKTKMFAGDPAPFVMELPAYHWPTRGQRAPLHVGARLVLHQEGRHDHPAVHHPRLVHHLLRRGRRHVPYADRGRDRLLHPGGHRQRHRLDLHAPRLGQLAGGCRLHHRPRRQGEHRRHARHPLWRRRRHRVREHRAAFTGISGYSLPGVQPAVRSLLRGYRRHQARDEQRKVDLVRHRLSVRLRLRDAP